ncbi:MAG: class I SAM-dependent rRNA methyltransferase [Bacteroidetes bacterium]|nr:class I SAM-dependent rRNA methyltransferase [Bacteroidota bacterium]
MVSPTPRTCIILRKNEDLRIRAGHVWVFSNEIRETHGSPAAGDIVEVRNVGGKPLGLGFYHPHSLIAVRLLSRTIEEIDDTFFRTRIANAAALRARLFPGNPVYRLVHGEADFLPGLVVDRFGEYLVVQTFACGMDLRLPLLCDILEEMFHPAGILERNESPSRVLEGLPLRSGILRGSAGTTIYEEDGLSFSIDLVSGQKTGFFLDQRLNRPLIRGFAPGSRVLDCFCNDGGFALHAARGGASSVLGIDSSGEAIARARINARNNGLLNTTFVENDVFAALGESAGRGDTFDVVVLDPPSFTKSRKTVPAAKKGYKELHHLAYRVLPPGGILLTASCSHHILPETFLSVIQETAVKDNREIQLLHWRGASPDHPTLPGVPETGYLKFGVFRVV